MTTDQTTTTIATLALQMPPDLGQMAPIARRMQMAALFAAHLQFPRAPDHAKRRIMAHHPFDPTGEGDAILAAIEPMAQTREEASLRRRFWINVAMASQQDGLCQYDPIQRRRYIPVAQHQTMRAMIIAMTSDAGLDVVSVTDWGQVIELLSRHDGWLAEFDAWCAADAALLEECERFAQTLRRP